MSLDDVLYTSAVRREGEGEDGGSSKASGVTDFKDMSALMVYLICQIENHAVLWVE